jgi:hypothetical protein
LAHKASSALAKVTKVVAQYQEQPKGQRRCEICTNFGPPESCTLVTGEISPKGWCQFFVPRENTL